MKGSSVKVNNIFNQKNQMATAITEDATADIINTPVESPVDVQIQENEQKEKFEMDQVFPDDENAEKQDINKGEKHPLHTRWTLWFDKPTGRTTTKNWEESVKELVTFGTIEDFWG